MPSITGDSGSTVYSNVTSVAEVTVDCNVVVSNAVISTVAISLFDLGANMVTCSLLSANTLSVANVTLTNLSVTKLTANVANVTTGNITTLSSNSATISYLSATSGNMSTLIVSGNTTLGNSVTGNSATFRGNVSVDGTVTANVLMANTITGLGGFGNITAGNLTVTGSLSASNVLTDNISPLANSVAPLNINTMGSVNMMGSTINFANSAGACSIVGGGSSIALKASGQYFFYASTGKVGIKTSSPSYPLDVAGATNVQGTLTARDVTASNSVTTYAFSGTSGSLSSLTVTSSATMAAVSVAALGVSGNASFVGAVTGAAATYTGNLTCSSNVRTDYISPYANTAAPLNIQTTGSVNMMGSTINFANSAGACSIVGGGSSIALKASGQTFFYASTGKVGIKTTSPSAVLDVAGSTNVQGTLTVSGLATLSGGATITGGLSSNVIGNLIDINESALVVSIGQTGGTLNQLYTYGFTATEQNAYFRQPYALIERMSSTTLFISAGASLVGALVGGSTAQYSSGIAITASRLYFNKAGLYEVSILGRLQDTTSTLALVPKKNGSNIYPTSDGAWWVTQDPNSRRCFSWSFHVCASLGDYVDVTCTYATTVQYAQLVCEYHMENPAGVGTTITTTLGTGS